MSTFETNTDTPVSTKTDNRYLMLLFSALLQFTVGVSYVWSVFQPFVMKEYNWDAHTASLTYTISVLALVIGGTAGGKIQDKLSPRIIIIGGGIIMALGSFLAYFTNASNPIYLCITFGLITGLGYGIVYNTGVTLSQKWFYDKRGMASGVVVSTLGFASILFTPLFNYILSTYGLKVTFIILSLFFILLSLFISFFVKNPPNGYGLDAEVKSIALTAKQYTPKEMIRTHNFFILLFSLMCGASGLILIAPLLLIIGVERGLSVPILLTCLMVGSFLNASGRLIAASVSDIIGRKLALIILFAISVISCTGLVFSYGYLFFAFFVLLSFAYGGFFAIFPALTSGSFGLKHAGANYSLVMSGLALASIVAMIISSAIHIMHLDLNARFISALVLAAIGLILAKFVKMPKQD